MTGFISGLLALGLLILNVVLVIGLMIALGRIALGHREGYRHAFGVLLAMVIVSLWTSNQLINVVHGIATYASSGGGPTVPPIPGQRP